ncbi:MAG: FRG domain-containing protein [Mariprofundus sp.]|nr:FRG domain-containing protein [Mariprofundus sp.]
MLESYKGQWIGTSKSGSYCIVNFDDKKGVINGRVAVFETVILDGKTFSYCSWAYFIVTVQNEGEISGEVSIPSIHSQDGELLADEKLRAFQEMANLDLPSATSFKGSKDGQYHLNIEWNSVYPSGNERTDSVCLEKKRLGGSVIRHEEMCWSKFKEFISTQEDGYIYRGQARCWRLQTSYHRTGNADLISYLDEKVPELENYINAYSKHVYDSSNDRSLGALLNLAQHHGYPTPLLDWTKSPYVASFFAFENQKELKRNGNISVFVFNDLGWASMAGRNAIIRSPKLSVRTMELPGYGNPRVIPQQSITMFANMDDIESIIKTNENHSGEYLRAISIPVEERDLAMRELALMGITWGALFPGLDGICKQLGFRHFQA